MKRRNSTRVLPVLVVSQFACTALWFAINGVLDDITDALHLPGTALSHLTTAVQAGFILGTLVFALLRIADRFHPSHVFLLCACIGAGINVLIVLPGITFTGLLLIRGATGFALAGIYPVGMKIAADYYEKGLGKALGWLVGALVLGTALPHLLRYLQGSADWRTVIYAVSGVALLGGVLVGGISKGPYRKQGAQLRVSDVFAVFVPVGFRRAAFGYFGHMWELYAFWAFLPLYLAAFQLHRNIGDAWSVSAWAFIAIAAGGLGCVWNGYLAMRTGVRRAAAGAIALSGICCLVSPLVFLFGSTWLFLLLMVVWGVSVVADSPMFSTLVAQEALPEVRGTALTLVTCIGFSITIMSIQLLGYVHTTNTVPYLFLLLVPGPAFGLYHTLRGQKSIK